MWDLIDMKFRHGTAATPKTREEHPLVTLFYTTGGTDDDLLTLRSPKGQEKLKRFITNFHKWKEKK